MKDKIRKLIPYFLLSQFRKFKREQMRKRNQGLTTEEVFSEIYKTNEWGGEKGEFNSGGGTTGEAIAEAYVGYFKNLEKEIPLSTLRVVDLGCGDMRIGNQISGLFGSYTGVDIVKDLIKSHQERFANEKTDFVCLNIVEDELPEGDVCLVRQVFQHLSNEQIQQVLAKLNRYSYVFITEHLPSDNPGLKVNLDKPHGGDVRLYDNSGVYLRKAPFSISEEQIETVLEVTGHGYENYEEDWITGVIRTDLYRPQSS